MGAVKQAVQDFGVLILQAEFVQSQESAVPHEETETDAFTVDRGHGRNTHVDGFAAHL